MSFTGSTCLTLQGLFLLIRYCNGQSGSRTGSGHRYGGGRGFAVLNNQDPGSENAGEQQEVDQRIVILLLVLLAVAVVGLLWQWCSYCHKIVNPPTILKDDPEEQRRELEVRYRALQQKFRDGQTTSTDSFNPEPPISALEAANNWTSASSPPSAEMGWDISQPPSQAPPQPPSSNTNFQGTVELTGTGINSTPTHIPPHTLNLNGRTVTMTTTTTTTVDGQVLITISPPEAPDWNQSGIKMQ